MNDNLIRPVTTGLDIQTNPKVNKNDSSYKNDFEKILNQTIKQNTDIKFSKHAMERLNQRNITLTQSEIEQVKDAIELADSKGIKRFTHSHG